MVKEVLVDVGIGEIRLAALENGQPVEIYIEKKDHESLVGNIYRGKVERVLPGMQAAFVDIGLEKNAFLYVKDVIPVSYNDEGELLFSGEDFSDISEVLSCGEEISVQVIKDATGNKGPRVSTRLSLPGRFCVMMPRSNVLGISKRITDQDERKRLRQIFEKAKPENVGIIVRTAAENVLEEQLIEDMEELEALCRGLALKEQKGAVPRLIYREPDIISHAIREYLKADTDRFLINNRKEYEKVLALLEDAAPGLKTKVQYFSKNYDMFAYYHVESALEEALSRKVWLKSGAYLIFDRTEALSVIDVNSGKFVGKSDLEETALKINLEAAKEIAHQIRLRNLSGIIIIDFIDMHQRDHRDQVVQTLKEAVKTDRTQTVVVDMTNLGLVELTRKKIRQPLYKSFTVDCRVCQGTGYYISPVTAARRIEKRIDSQMADAGHGCLEVCVHPEILRILETSEKDFIEKLKTRYNCGLKLISSKDADYDEAFIRKIEI